MKKSDKHKKSVKETGDCEDEEEAKEEKGGSGEGKPERRPWTRPECACGWTPAPPGGSALWPLS